MTELKNVEEKERVAKELRGLIDKANEIIKTAPPFLIIRVTQNEGQHMGKSAFINLWVEETVIY